MGFANPVVDSDDKDDDIFKPGRRFSDVFDTFVNKVCTKKDGNVFKFAFRFLAFPEIPEILETHINKKFNLQHIRKIAPCRKLWYFGKTAKSKCCEM